MSSESSGPSGPSEPVPQRNPFLEEPPPSFVEVDSVTFDEAWDGEHAAHVACPVGDLGRFKQRGTADGRNWVTFAPCGHVVVLAEWDVF
jgi:hypothetical protein